jgi:hypothetical protein
MPKSQIHLSHGTFALSMPVLRFNYMLEPVPCLMVEKPSRVDLVSVPLLHLTMFRPIRLCQMNYDTLKRSTALTQKTKKGRRPPAGQSQMEPNTKSLSCPSLEVPCFFPGTPKFVNVLTQFRLQQALRQSRALLCLAQLQLLLPHQAMQIQR